MGRIYDLSHTAPAARHSLITAGKGTQPSRIADDDARAIARDDPVLLELREGARDELSNGAEPRRELRLGQSEVDRGAGPHGDGGRRVQESGQTLGHRAKGEVTDDAGEVTDPARHRPQHRERHRRASVTETEHLGARDEQHARGHDGDSGGDVAAPIEERPLAERGARSFRVEDLLAASEGDLPDLDTTVGDDEEAPARLTLLEESFSGAKDLRGAAPGQTPQLGGRQGREV